MKKDLGLQLAWDQAPHWGEKGKKRGQIGKISASEISRARFFFFANAVFFPFSPQCGAWSHARLQSNRENHEHQKYFRNVIVLREKKNNQT